MSFLFVVLLLFTISVDDFFGTCLGAELNSSLVSALGDPGMKGLDTRFALEAWNACNEAGEEVPEMVGSPRLADCADFKCSNPGNKSTCNVTHKVDSEINGLIAGHPFSFAIGFNATDFNPSEDVNIYAAEKEKYLGALCETKDTVDKEAWYFWMIMVKNGNLDMKNKTVNCPRYGRKANTTELTWDKPFPCFGKGCMNQPLMFCNESWLNDNTSFPSLTGMFYGSYDLDSNVTIYNSTAPSNKSYFAVTWQKNITNPSTPANSSWILSFKLTTSDKYPWLAMYLRADAATGPNAGYPYEGRGIMNVNKLLKSPNFKVKMTLHIIHGGGEISQFSLTNIGGCWKNNGEPCNGDVTTDVTRYVQMIINPTISITCGSDNLKACPPYHKDTTTGEIIYKNETTKFPYKAYHLYSAPGNAMLNDTDKSDPFTNPMQQELVQIRPHNVWGSLGFPTTTEDVGWEDTAGPKTWNLDAGKLTAGMYFYQHPNALIPATRIWTSIMVGTKMYNLKKEDHQYTAEWTVSDFDVVVPK